MNKQNLFKLFFIILISGCEQDKTINSSITIFEKHPNWTYLFCEDWLKNGPGSKYYDYDEDLEVIKHNALLVIEPEKKTPVIYAWQYNYQLDLAWEGTQTLEQENAIISDMTPIEIKSWVDNHPNKYEPNFKLSSFKKTSAPSCVGEMHETKGCIIYRINANWAGYYMSYSSRKGQKLSTESQFLYLNRTNLYLDENKNYVKDDDFSRRNLIRPGRVCKIVDINSNEFNETKKRIKEDYEKAIKYHQHVIDRYNAIKPELEFKI